MVFGSPKQDTPVGLLAKSPMDAGAGSDISNADVLEVLPQIQAVGLKRPISEALLQEAQSLDIQKPTKMAAVPDIAEGGKKRAAVLLPAMNSAQSLAASAEIATPELLAAKLRYERTKGLYAKKNAEKLIAKPSFKSKPQPKSKQKEPSAFRQKPQALPDTWLHQDEQWYWWLAFGSSVLMYMGTATLLIWAFILDENPILFAIAASTITYFTVQWYYQGRALKLLYETGLRVTERQFPELFAEVGDVASKLGMKKAPAMFVVKAGEMAEIRAVRLLGSDVILLPSGLVSLIYQNELPAVSYLMAREMVKIKRRHNRFHWNILPALLLPFVGSGYRQTCVLTCDRAAAFCKPEGAINGLKLLASGNALYDHIMMDMLVPDRKHGLFSSLLLACAKKPPFAKRFQQLLQLPIIQNVIN